MEDRIKSWIEEKIEEGVEEERIRNVLEEQGHDPSLVDEVQAPFDATDSEEAEDFFQHDEDMQTDTTENEDETVKQKVESLEPDFNNFDKSKLVKPGAALAIILLLVGGYTFAGDAVEGFLSNDHLKGCRDVGVMVRDVNIENDQTVAQVEVVRNKSIAVLEVWQDNKKLGESTATFQGEREMKVDAVGNRVRFHPAECNRYVSERSY